MMHSGLRSIANLSHSAVIFLMGALAPLFFVTSAAMPRQSSFEAQISTQTVLIRPDRVSPCRSLSVHHIG